MISLSYAERKSPDNDKNLFKHSEFHMFYNINPRRYFSISLIQFVRRYTHRANRQKGKKKSVFSFYTWCFQLVLVVVYQ